MEHTNGITKRVLLYDEFTRTNTVHRLYWTYQEISQIEDESFNEYERTFAGSSEEPEEGLYICSCCHNRKENAVDDDPFFGHDSECIVLHWIINDKLCDIAEQEDK